MVYSIPFTVLSSSRRKGEERTGSLDVGGEEDAELHHREQNRVLCPE
jgi:hypothetical protein